MAPHTGQSSQLFPAANAAVFKEARGRIYTTTSYIQRSNNRLNPERSAKLAPFRLVRYLSSVEDYSELERPVADSELSIGHQRLKLTLICWYGAKI